MKKLISQFLAGITTTLVLLGIFFFCQTGFSQNYDNSLVSRADSMNRLVVQRLDNQLAQSLELKTEVMERYVEASQKNLDMWLKILVVILSVLAGLTVLYGMRMRETVKDELNDIRRIKDEIKNLASETESHLMLLKAQLSKTESSAKHESVLTRKMTEQLFEIGRKKEQPLSINDKKVIDESVSELKESLHRNGIESLQNLYLAKALKALGSKRWDDAVRLLSSYIDFDETSQDAYFYRGLALLELSRASEEMRKVEYANRSVLDFSEVIRLNPDHSLAFNNRGIAFTLISEHAKAVSDFNEAINLLPNAALYYYSRAGVYTKMGMDAYAERDITKALELEGSKPLMS